MRSLSTVARTALSTDTGNIFATAFIVRLLIHSAAFPYFGDMRSGIRHAASMGAVLMSFDVAFRLLLTAEGDQDDRMRVIYLSVTGLFLLAGGLMGSAAEALSHDSTWF